MSASRPAKAKPKNRVVALALTWDGARWPVRSLPPEARAFLAGQSRTVPAPSAQAVAKLFSDDQVQEIRICRVPVLKGGCKVLSDPFPTATGKRIAFWIVKTTRLGDHLGIVYRR